MAESNFQDVVVLSSNSLQVRGQAISVGTDPGAKSIILANDVAGLYLNANPTANRSVLLQDASGTVGLVTAFSAGTTQVINGGLVFSNSNGFSFGLNGSTITASYTQSNAPQAISAGTTLASTGTVVFSNSNGFSFGMNGNTITASYTQSVTPAVFGIGASTGGNTAGNTGTTFGTFVFAGVGGISLSQSTAAGSLATLSISMTQSTSPGAIAAGTQTATSGTVIFSNSNGITFGMSNSSVITASFSPSAAAVKMFSQWAEFDTNFAITPATISFQKVSVPVNISATAAAIMMALSGASNSSGALTVSLAVYTMNAATASLFSSASRSLSWTSGSQTSASSLYGGASGSRYRTIGFNVTLTPGDYLMAFNFSTTNNGTWRMFGRMGLNVVGVYDGFETSNWLDGQSGSSSLAFPSSVVNTQTANYIMTGLGPMQQGGVILAGTF